MYLPSRLPEPHCQRSHHDFLFSLTFFTHSSHIQGALIIMHGFRIWCCATSHQQRVATPRRHHAWLQDMMLRNISSAEVGNPKKRSCSQALHQGLPGQLQCILLRARNACPHVMSCSQALHRVFLASSRSSCTLLGCHVHKPSIKVFLASSSASCSVLGMLALMSCHVHKPSIEYFWPALDHPAPCWDVMFTSPPSRSSWPAPMHPAPCWDP